MDHPASTSTADHRISTGEKLIIALASLSAVALVTFLLWLHFALRVHFRPVARSQISRPLQHISSEDQEADVTAGIPLSEMIPASRRLQPVASTSISNTADAQIKDQCKVPQEASRPAKLSLSHLNLVENLTSLQRKWRKRGKGLSQEVLISGPAIEPEKRRPESSLYAAFEVASSTFCPSSSTPERAPWSAVGPLENFGRIQDAPATRATLVAGCAAASLQSMVASPVVDPTTTSEHAQLQHSSRLSAPDLATELARCGLNTSNPFDSPVSSIDSFEAINHRTSLDGISQPVSPICNQRLSLVGTRPATSRSGDRAQMQLSPVSPVEQSPSWQIRRPAMAGPGSYRSPATDAFVCEEAASLRVMLRDRMELTEEEKTG